MDFSVTVNNKTLPAKKGETILHLLTKNGIRIPTLCYMDGFKPTGACRLCLVELKGQNDLITACNHPVEPGMQINTHTPRVLNARKNIVELLLASHPDDCLYCNNNNQCELQDLATELNITEQKFPGKPGPMDKDDSHPAIIKDNSKCILCGRCVQVCNEKIQAAALDFSGRGNNMKVDTLLGKGLEQSSCISCGQCIMVCPTAALSEKSYVNTSFQYLQQEKTFTVAQLSPVTGYILAEKAGFKPGTDITPLLTSSFKQIGFDAVFNCGFAADVFLMLTANHIIKSKLNPVIITSCPSVIKFIEQFYPGFIPYLNPYKTPQQILGKIIKNPELKRNFNHGKAIQTVSVNPCIAAKDEQTRSENVTSGTPDVDIVLGTNDVLRLLSLSGVNLHSIKKRTFDAPYQVSSSAGYLYNIPGGLTEAVYRTMHMIKTGQAPQHHKLPEIRKIKNKKETTFNVHGKTYKSVSICGISNIERTLEDVIQGNNDFDILEFSNCNMGCIGSRIQQCLTPQANEKARNLIKTIYKLDDNTNMKNPANNPFIKNFFNNNILPGMKRT